jgi:molecular chaperone GrpE (heat shock protein)
MNEENLDEFEDMGIPIDDLAAQSPCPSSSEESQSDSDQASDTPSLPELFDEDELAEVGLVAGDGETFNDAPEGALPAAEPSASTEDDVPLDPQNETPPPDAIAEPEIARDEETPLEPIWPSIDESEHSAAELIDETGPALQDADVAAEIAPELPFEEPDLIERIHQIGLQMTALQREFEGKLKYDAHKDEIIDKLHNELQEYKQDILKKHILSIVMDVVKVADDIRKWLTYFRSLEVSQRDPRKLFRYLEAIPSDLEDIFYWHGVRPFSTAEGIFDPTRQRAIKKVPSMDASQDKLIAESIRPGYEWDGKVIRQEMVAVYVYQEEQESSTMGMNNE